MTKLTQPVILATLGLVAVVVIAAAVLGATGNPVPTWFESLALAGLAGALGAYNGPGSLVSPPVPQNPPAPVPAPAAPVAVPPAPVPNPAS